MFCVSLTGPESVNPEDPNVIAENELLGVVASIEAAARKLAELTPRARPKVGRQRLGGKFSVWRDLALLCEEMFIKTQ